MGAAVLQKVRLTLRLEPDIEIEASDKAAAIAEAMSMSSDKVDEVRMAIVEACINAVEHSKSEDRTLYLTFEVLGADSSSADSSSKAGGSEPVALRITVADRGAGFDRGKVVEPTIEKKLHAVRKRGWGLKIIEGLMDHVSVESSDSGTAVVMSKER